MRNAYGGFCLCCEKFVKPGAGFFQRVPQAPKGRRWRVRCYDCVGRGNTKTIPNPPSKERRDVNEPQPADDRAQRIAEIREHQVKEREHECNKDCYLYDCPRNPEAHFSFTEEHFSWLLDELEKADKKIAYDEAVLVRVTKAIENTAAERDALEAKIAQIREVMDSEARDAISWRKIRSIIDTPASEGKTS